MLSTVRSELTKIITLPSVWIVTGILLALSIYFQFQGYLYIGQALETLDADGNHWWYRRPVPAVLDIASDVGGGVFQPGIFFPILGAVIAGAEFRTGQLGISVLAVPNRYRMVLGKTIATAIYALGFGLAFAVMALVSTYLATRHWEPDLVWRPDALMGLGGAVLFLVAITLISFGFTLMTRRTLFGILITSAFTGLVMIPVLYGISPLLDALTPMSAARNWLLQTDVLEDVGGRPFSSGPEFGALVLASWATLVPIAAAVTIQGRDAR